MARRRKAPPPTSEEVLSPIRDVCASCGQRMWVRYRNDRTLIMLGGEVKHLLLSIRRCENERCEVYKRPYRPEAELGYALPKHEIGLDVIARIGQLRFSSRMSVPEIHRQLETEGVRISERSVTNMVERYEELVSLRIGDNGRLREMLGKQGKLILAIDGLQPDNGHEVLWVLWDCLSAEVLLARSLLSATQKDLSGLIGEVRDTVGVPIVGVISDGQNSLKNAVAQALPGVPHQICQFHYLRSAAQPIAEADRHAKKELKKRVRGIRAIEREAERLGGPQAEQLRGYCSAVRGAITDNNERPPLSAAGLRLHGRLEEIRDSLSRVERKRGAYHRASDG